MMEFLKKLLGKKSEKATPSVVDTKDNDKIKRRSIVKDKKGKYHQVLLVMDGRVFFDDGYDWITTQNIIAHCKTLPLKDVILVEE